MNPNMQKIVMTIEDMIGVIYVVDHADPTTEDQARHQKVLRVAHTYNQEQTLPPIKDDILIIVQHYMDICDLLPFVDPDMWDRVKQVKEFCGDFSMKPAAEY